MMTGKIFILFLLFTLATFLPIGFIGSLLRTTANKFAIQLRKDPCYVEGCYCPHGIIRHDMDAYYFGPAEDVYAKYCENDEDHDVGVRKSIRNSKTLEFCSNLKKTAASCLKNVKETKIWESHALEEQGEANATMFVCKRDEWKTCECNCSYSSTKMKDCENVHEKNFEFTTVHFRPKVLGLQSIFQKTSGKDFTGLVVAWDTERRQKKENIGIRKIESFRKKEQTRLHAECMEREKNQEKKE